MAQMLSPLFLSFVWLIKKKCINLQREMYLIWQEKMS